LAELAELAVSDGEYDELHGRFKRLSKGQDIEARVAAALDALSGETESGVDAIGRVATSLATIDDAHPALEAPRGLLDTALTHLDETARELRRYFESLASSPDELTTIEQRLDRMTELARKHRVRPEMLAQRHSELIAELETLRSGDSDIEAVRQ